MEYVDIPNGASGHYSAGVISGNMLYISGQLANDPITGALPEGIRAQTKACLEKVESVLKQAGADRNNVVMCRIFMADHSFWGDMNDEYAAFFGNHKPARIAVPIKGFKPGVLIEIEAVAELQ